MFTELFSNFSNPLVFSQIYTILVFIIISTLTAFWYYHKVGRKAYYLRKCPGIPRYPFVGNVTYLTNGLFKPLPPFATTCKA